MSINQFTEISSVIINMHMGKGSGLLPLLLFHKVIISVIITGLYIDHDLF